MIYIVYGAVGVVAVLLLFIAGCFTGWKLHVAYEKHNRALTPAPTPAEEERRELTESLKALDSMLNYNADVAYNMKRIDGGER